MRSVGLRLSHALPAHHAPGPVALACLHRRGEVAKLHGGALFPAPFFVTVRGDTRVGADASAGQHHHAARREQPSQLAEVRARVYRRRIDHASGLAGRSALAQRRPLKPIMFCTTASLASATSPCSRTSSAHDSQSFFVLPATLTVTSSSASSPQDLQVGIFFPSLGRGYTRRRSRQALFFGVALSGRRAKAEFSGVCLNCGTLRDAPSRRRRDA